jgi:hypothetical protein
MYVKNEHWGFQVSQGVPEKDKNYNLACKNQSVLMGTHYDQCFSRRQTDQKFRKKIEYAYLNLSSPGICWL